MRSGVGQGSGIIGHRALFLIRFKINVNGFPRCRTIPVQVELSYFV